MLHELRGELAALVAGHIRSLYGLEVEPTVEIAPRRELGDLAVPTALHLARTLRKSPRQIAQEILEDLGPTPSWIREVRVQGAGYLNVFLHRSALSARLLSDPLLGPGAREKEKVVVEHTNINPNKAAHIGHLRNAVLGDSLARLLRSLGHRVEVQNYIDDTGVQLADVVVGFLDLEGASLSDVEELPEPFDYYCWDLYSRVRRWLEEDPSRQELRRRTLRTLESGEGERAAMGRLVARRVVHRHLRTMARLGVSYDLLTHERDILRRDFFARAFAELRDAGALRYEEEGRNAGCWVMPLAESSEFAGLEDPDKVIVRSDGTVTYVGKDIAYQLWKLGLLERDFGYRRDQEEGLWMTTDEGVEEHPSFGGADRVINVIDARQSYLQKIVRAGVEALGHREAAERSIHFAYEMVSLSRETALAMGFVSDGDEEGGEEQGQSLEMSGRRGIGVKADDLMDRLEAKSREEIARRNRELSDEELTHLARQIATGALRFFMTKATTSRVIVFDLEEALNFEGETGPYLQYALVRSRNIRRKLQEAGMVDTVSTEEAGAVPEEDWSDDLWDLVLGVAQTSETVARAGESLELSLVARHGLELAQRFNAVYHRHPVLQEKDPRKRRVRLLATQVFARGLEQIMELLGIPAPERM